jgi:UDPglucose 6-dehydrogenase
MHIAMIGSGYVGLASGACLADFGHDVICVVSVVAAREVGLCSGPYFPRLVFK